MLLLVLGVEENILEWCKPEQISCHHASNNYCAEKFSKSCHEKKEKVCNVLPFSYSVCLLLQIGGYNSQPTDSSHSGKSN